ncbi:metal ABC transporter permease [bacterium]|nr:metal ABC transporter permease [bacterium]
MEIFKLPFFQKAIISGVLVGLTCGIVGVWVFLMKISFIGVAISHSAFSGALLALLLNKPVIPFTFLFSFLASCLLGPLSDKGEISPDTSIGILFSLTLGISFLLLGILPGAKTQALNLLWGSMLILEKVDLILLFITAILTVFITVVFFKEIQAVIFSRELAKSSGIPSTLFFYLILFLTGMVVSSNLKSVGGLLVFSLIINPSASAYQITYDIKRMYVLSALFGILSCWAGLFFSAFFDTPVGATIILFSGFLFFFCVIFSPKRKRKWRREESFSIKSH